MFFGGVWRLQMAAQLEVRASIPLLGNRGGAGTGLPCAYFQGRQVLPESEGEFGAVVPIAVSRTKPIIEGAGFRFFLFLARRVWAQNAFFGAFFCGEGH